MQLKDSLPTLGRLSLQVPDARGTALAAAGHSLAVCMCRSAMPGLGDWQGCSLPGQKPCCLLLLARRIWGQGWGGT